MRIRHATLVLAVLSLGACNAGSSRTNEAPAAAPAADLQFLHPFGAPTRPFSPAVRVGNLIYLAGQIGTDPSAGGTVVAGGIAAETRQVMENIKRVAEAVGSSMDRLAKCTVFMADMKEWDAMNEVYRTFFTAPNFPARSALGVNGLALNARVEIECIAVAK
jgi:reactive intermediate/imine deaminase